MKVEDIQEIENKCIASIRNNDLDAFSYNFNIVKYQYGHQKTPTSAYVKASHLIYLLATHFIDYLCFLETLDYEDTRDENIIFVLRIEQLMTEENVSAIRKQMGKFKE